MSELDQLHPNSLAARDHGISQTPVDVAALFDEVVAQSGRPGQEMLKEIKQGKKWPGQITALEYMRHRIYERDRGARKEFISDWLHWPIHEFCSDPEWSPKTVDKWQCTDELAQAGIPVIPILAVVDRSSTDYGTTPNLSSPEELAAFLAGADFPLFAKPNRLLGSFGAFRIEGVTGDEIDTGHEQVPLSDLIETFMSDEPYVFQPVVTNHNSMDGYAAALATVRTVNLVSPNSVQLVAAVLKMPVGDNIADNAWRDGNLVADVDPATGVIRRAVSGTGPAMIVHEHHPDTGVTLPGIQLPLWAQVLELNEQTASHFSKIRYQSLDIAITNNGPVVVEVNSGSSFSLPQQASGHGFLTSGTKKFFESCGVNFRKLPSTPE